jgi:hypothetical protein
VRRPACRGSGEDRIRTPYGNSISRQTTVRRPEEIADRAEADGRVRGTSVNTVLVESLRAETEHVRADKDFTDRAKRLLERDWELFERLAR